MVLYQVHLQFCSKASVVICSILHNHIFTVRLCLSNLNNYIENTAFFSLNTYICFHLHLPHCVISCVLTITDTLMYLFVNIGQYSFAHILSQRTEMPILIGHVTAIDRLLHRNVLLFPHVHTYKTLQLFQLSITKEHRRQRPLKSRRFFPDGP